MSAWDPDTPLDYRPDPLRFKWRDVLVALGIVYLLGWLWGKR